MDGGVFVGAGPIRLESFRPETMDGIVLRWPNMMGDMSILRDGVAANHAHNARVAFCGSEPIGAGGVIELWHGVGLAWVAVAKLPPRLAVAAVRACGLGLDQIQAIGGFHRLQADIKREFVAARKLAILLGFSYEGPMDGYGADKSDFDRYARVRK